MPDERFIDADFVAVYDGIETNEKSKISLVFGERVNVIDERDDGWTEIEAPTRVDFFTEETVKGFIRGTPFRDQGVLALSMVDVQQGDGIILETPKGKIVFIDGGDNKLFARHAAARFRYSKSTTDNPLEVDAIIITHGDGDHFDGLNKIRKSESLTGSSKRKRLFIHPKRVFHNGLVKAPSSFKDSEIFGETVEDGGDLYVSDLYDDPRDAPHGMKNKFFKAWHQTLDHWEKDRDQIEMTRVAFGMDEAEMFDFLLEEGIDVEIQGPFQTIFEDSGSGEEFPTLPFFHTPRKSAELHLDDEDEGGSVSASHTINGHSIALRLSFGNVRFNLTGDLNQEAMELMRDNLELDNNPDVLEAEIVKAPHHGSHDFDFQALKAMRPVVAICSSGDEHAGKEHIHPRATLMAALGKVMRQNTGVILCTELAAFFAVQGECLQREDLAAYFKEHQDESFTGEELRKLFSGKPEFDPKPLRPFFGFRRTNFGIIHIRTDGERVLVFTHSGKKGVNEAYRFSVTVDSQGKRKVKFAKQVEVVTRSSN